MNGIEEANGIIGGVLVVSDHSSLHSYQYLPPIVSNIKKEKKISKKNYEFYILDWNLVLKTIAYSLWTPDLVTQRSHNVIVSKIRSLFLHKFHSSTYYIALNICIIGELSKIIRTCKIYMLSVHNIYTSLFVFIMHITYFYQLINYICIWLMGHWSQLMEYIGANEGFCI